LTRAATPTNLAGIVSAICADGSGRRDPVHWKPILANIIRYLSKAALLSAKIAIVALPSLARAQSGSAGGSIDRA
jgi:hypothetical protein